MKHLKNWKRAFEYWGRIGYWKRSFFFAEIEISCKFADYTENIEIFEKNIEITEIDMEKFDGVDKKNRKSKWFIFEFKILISFFSVAFFCIFIVPYFFHLFYVFNKIGNNRTKRGPFNKFFKIRIKFVSNSNELNWNNNDACVFGMFNNVDDEIWNFTIVTSVGNALKNCFKWFECWRLLNNQIHP